MHRQALTAIAFAALATTLAFASPAQAQVPPDEIEGPCQHWQPQSPDVLVVVADSCRRNFSNWEQVVEWLLFNGASPECSTSENVVPLLVECAVWTVEQVPDVPSVPNPNALLTWVITYSGEVNAWGNGYVAKVNAYPGKVGLYIGGLEGYGALVGAWGTGATGEALTQAGALLNYAICRAVSPDPCGFTPMVTLPPVPPTPGTPPGPPVPATPPTPSAPPA